MGGSLAWSGGEVDRDIASAPAHAQQGIKACVCLEETQHFRLLREFCLDPELFIAMMLNG
ncbi:hypothetical protein [Microvirga sp. 17 mud 1-3]|uniref:hypothetical protein n=1 Tax=Microvirga sp. 17 mud 1-3 TaxID=2082949 RepID=UPI0013A5AD42|nr:hypothetical protein [Microvirga sp. 17 mud 1-3]